MNTERTSTDELSLSLSLGPVVRFGDSLRSSRCYNTEPDLRTELRTGPENRAEDRAVDMGWTHVLPVPADRDEGMGKPLPLGNQ